MRLGPYILFILFSSTSFANVCSRSPVIVKFLENVTKKPCQSITNADLARIQNNENAFDFERRNLVLKKGDFEGLVALRDLDLPRSGLINIPEGIFDSLKSLNYLDLSENQIAVIPKNMIKNLPNLGTLILSDNRITKIPDSFFSNSKRLSLISFHGNPIESISKAAFTGLEVNSTDFSPVISIGRTKINHIEEGTFSQIKGEVAYLDIADSRLNEADYKMLADELPRTWIDVRCPGLDDKGYPRVCRYPYK